MIMTALTPKQKRVLNSIRVFQAEYHEGVPYNILKLDLNIPEEDLTSILGYLGKEGYISRQDGVIIIKKESKMDQEVNIPETQSKENAKVTDEHESSNLSVDDSEGKVDEAGDKNQLSEKEQISLEIIRGLVNEDGNISRTLLEGTLLYGELELSNIGMYNLITSLENKGILKKIQLTDGEYYHFTP